MFEKGHYKWDLLFIPLLSPFFWWLGWQFDKAKYLSEKDTLTGLYNRRFVSNITPKLLTQMDKRNKKLTISLIDCDNFKQINDTFGHKTGDLVLGNLSSILSKCCKNAIVARWGGDEFLVVTPNSNLTEFELVSKQLDEGLKKMSKEMGIDISVSIGIAVYPLDADTETDLFKIADKKMYESKVNQPQNRKKLQFSEI